VRRPDEAVKVCFKELHFCFIPSFLGRGTAFIVIAAVASFFFRWAPKAAAVKAVTAVIQGN
jgi:hypothetical protein